MSEQFEKAIQAEYAAGADRAEVYNYIARLNAALLGFPHPVSCTQWIPVDHIRSNSWNPNAVAPNEMRLLLTSIKADGYTQGTVTMKDGDTYEIVDGYHRYSVMRNCPEIAKTTGGRLPIVVIDKNPSQRMASTVRHNRARGKHSVAGMASLVFKLLQNGETDEMICNHVGTTPDELLRLKHVTGFSKLFADTKYSQVWTTPEQIEAKKQYEAKGHE
jgi:hypothetical protein